MGGLGSDTLEYIPSLKNSTQVIEVHKLADRGK